MLPTQHTRHFLGHLRLVSQSKQVYFLLFLLPSFDPSSITATQFTRHFRDGTCVLFTLGNSCVSCFATHAIKRFVKGIFKSIFNTTPGQNPPDSNDNESVHHTSLFPRRGASLSDAVYYHINDTFSYRGYNEHILNSIIRTVGNNEHPFYYYYKVDVTL